MKKNALIGALFAVLGAGGAYRYLATARSPSTGETAVQGAASAFCAEHQIAEAECPWCDPGLIEKGGACTEHGVPEALCSRCNPRLIAGFEAENDWCGGHGIPESQCILCNPELLVDSPSPPAEAPGSATGPPASGQDLPRSQRPPSSACATQDRRIQFTSPDTARQAGLATVAVERRAVTRILSCSAEIEFDGGRYARLGPPVPAVVHEVRRDVGDTVKGGAVLAVLSSEALGTAKAEYLKFRESLVVTRLEIERASGFYERMNRTEVRLTALDYLEAKQLLEVARTHFERERNLRDQGISSEKEWLDERASFLRAEADFRSLRGKLVLFEVAVAELDALTWETVDSISGRGTRSDKAVLEARMALRTAEADLESGRNRLRVLGLSDDDIERVAEAHDTSGLLALVAPFDARVVECHAVIGEVVSSAQTLFAIADTSGMWAMLDVYEEDVGSVRAGQPVVFEAEGLGRERFSGRITVVNAYMDRRTRTLKARAVVANPDGVLRAGMFGCALVTISERADALLLPKEAVQWEGCCNVAFVKRSDMLFEPRKLRLGHETDGFFVVEGGVDEGEEVVTTGSFLLKTEILKGSIGAGCCPETGRE